MTKGRWIPVGRGVAAWFWGLLLSQLVPDAAQAQSSVTSEVLVVLAREEVGEVDRALTGLPALRRPPFNAFRSMKLLERKALKLSKGKPVQVRLPNGRALRIALLGRLPDGRYRVKVSINRPKRRDYLPLLTVVAAPGDPFFVAGQRYQGGTLVVGVRVGTPPAGAAVRRGR